MSASTTNDSTSFAYREQEWSLASLMEFWIYGALIPIVAIPGVLANLASLVVFTRPAMRSSLNLYLAGLSCFDMALLLSALAIYPPLVYCWSSVSSSITCSRLVRSLVVTFPLSLIAQFGSVWTCVAISVDRFIAVRYPFKKSQYCTQRNACKVLLAITVAAILYQIPAMLELQMKGNGIEMSALRKSGLYIVIYKTALYSTVLFAVPFSLMIVLNIFLGRSLRKAQTIQFIAHRERRRRARQTRRWTLITILVTVSILAFNSLATINNIVEVFLEKHLLALSHKNGI